jgi:biopolymer transport protein ExbB
MPELVYNVTHLFSLGGPVMWVLLGVCLLLWFLIVERFWFVRLTYPALRDSTLQQWHAQAEHDSWQARALRRELVCEVRLALTAWLSTLRMLVAICPLLGLLGTVTGMIHVFELITLTGGEGRTLANGIYRATIPTMSGLLVSLSGQYFSSRLRYLAEREQQRFADLLTRD